MTTSFDLGDFRRSTDDSEPASAPNKLRRRSPHRKATLASLSLDEPAAAFAGLPTGITSPSHLLDVFKRAAPELGIPRPVITLLDHLFRHTNPKDWQPGSRPLVWPSNGMIAKSLDLTENAVGLAISAASKLGIVVMKDSPTRQRRGVRDKSGAVDPALSFGFDLSPLALRYEEFVGAADQRDGLIKAHAVARRTITVTRHKLAQITETAFEQSLWDAGWDDLQGRIDSVAVPRRLSTQLLPQLKDMAQRLTVLEGEARTLLDAGLIEPTPASGTKDTGVASSSTYDSTTGGAPPENYVPMNSITNNSKEEIEATGGEAQSVGNGPTGLLQATRMIDVFESVGVEKFDITHTNIEQEKRGFRPAQTLEQVRGSLPFLVPSAAKRQNNLIVRPRAGAVTLIQLDDLEPINLEEIAPLAFLTLQTSAAGLQAWVAVADAPKGLASRLRRGLLADANASGSVRVAGTQNFKRQYGPAYPIVTILKAIPGRVVTVADLDAIGVLSPAAPTPPPVASPLFRRLGTAKKWPCYQRCLDGAPIGPSGNPKRTAADFVWCKIAASWGHGLEAIAERLMTESTKAQENGEAYALQTVEHAAYAAEQRNLGRG